MKVFSVLFFLSIISVVCSQEIDINTKNGFGVNGYDVVSYFKENPKKGSKEFKTTHNNIDYKFSSQENLKLFKINPEKYLPQYGGYCAYAIGKRNTKMKIDPQTYKIIDGKLFLFYNFWLTNTSKLWDEEKNIKSKSDKNWEALQFK